MKALKKVERQLDEFLKELGRGLSSKAAMNKLKLLTRDLTSISSRLPPPGSGDPQVEDTVGRLNFMREEVASAIVKQREDEMMAAIPEPTKSPKSPRRQKSPRRKARMDEQQVPSPLKPSGTAIAVEFTTESFDPNA